MSFNIFSNSIQCIYTFYGPILLDQIEYVYFEVNTYIFKHNIVNVRTLKNIEQFSYNNNNCYSFHRRTGSQFNTDQFCIHVDLDVYMCRQAKVRTRKKNIDAIECSLTFRQNGDFRKKGALLSMALAYLY